MLKKEDGLLNFDKKAIEVVNFIRGMTPWPSAYTTYSGAKIKILQAEVCDFDGGKTSGEIVQSDIKQGLIVKCHSGYIRINRIQAENGKAMDVAAYLLGKKLTVGGVFGEGSI